MGARIEAFMEEMRAIADDFPKEPKPLGANSLELLRFWNSWRCNALLIEKMQLARVDSDWGFAKEDYFEVGAGYTLADFLSERHDSNQDAPEYYRQSMEDVLGIRYLVIADIYYDTPVFVSEKSARESIRRDGLRARFSRGIAFLKGEAHGKVAIYDRKAEAWVGGFQCEAKPPEFVEFEVDEEWHFSRDLPHYVRSKTEYEFEMCIQERLKPFLDDSNSSRMLEKPLPSSPETGSP